MVTFNYRPVLQRVKLNENIIIFLIFFKDLTTDDLVVEETVDNDYEFGKTLQVCDISK